MRLCIPISAPPMCLQSLPLELLFEITSHLSEVDQQCLRSSCKDFQVAMEPLRPIPSNWPRHFYIITEEKKARLAVLEELATRLMEPGNIYSAKDIGVCGFCLTIRERNPHFPTKNFRLNGLEQCLDCRMYLLSTTMPPNCQLTYGNKALIKCRACGEPVPKQDINKHRVWPWETSITQKMCTKCHLEWCDDAGCVGWAEGYIDKNPAHFSKLAVSGTFKKVCSCNRCKMVQQRKALYMAIWSQYSDPDSASNLEQSFARFAR